MKLSQFFSLSWLLTTLGCSASSIDAEASGGAGAELPDPGGSAGAAGEVGSGTAGSIGADAGSFGASDCRTCWAEACASPEAECASEPGCGGYLDCVDACPDAESGGPDATCASACALPEATTIRTLAERVQRCRETGDGLTCECGQARGTSDILVQECAPSQETVPCYVCEDEKCCNTQADCLGDPACVAYQGCVRECVSAPVRGVDCQLTCGEQHPDGFEKGLRRFACVFANCIGEDECADVPPDACDVCTRSYCAEEMVACVASAACKRAGLCSDACAKDPDCVQGCFEQEPEGGEQLTGWVECLLAKCPGECG